MMHLTPCRVPTRRLLGALLLGWLAIATPPLRADAPVASYLFPAGGQRGQSVAVRVGGLNLHERCGFEVLGPGVSAPRELKQTKTIWFEGPLLPLPESQQAEDYPKDMAGRIDIAADAPLGVRHARLWTSQGATPALRFVVGELPEIVEQEIEGNPVPVKVAVPVTVNGRIFPREDVDLWAFAAKKGQTVTCDLWAARLGSPLDARLEVIDAAGRPLAEAIGGRTADPWLHFTAPEDGTYQVRVQDVGARGGQAFVYRLTLTDGPFVDRVYPLGGRRGSTVSLTASGAGLPAGPIAVTLPTAAPQEFVVSLDVDDRRTNPILLDVDDLPEHHRGDRGPAQPIALPAVLNGRLDRPGAVHPWPIRLEKGSVAEIELRAARLGSPLLGVLTLTDAAGKELARADAVAGGTADPSLRFTAPAAGTYVITIRDRFTSRGGPEFAYRLRVAPPAKPDFALRLTSDAVTLPRGGQVKLRVLADRVGGHTAAIPLTLDGLPPGVTATNTTIAAGQSSVEISLTAAATAPIEARRLTVRASPTHTAVLPGGRGVPAIDSVLLAVALPTPFKVVGTYDMRWAARGTVHTRHYRIERNGFTGPIQVRLADRQARHLQGVTGPMITVPPGISEFDYPVTLPPWMETGRTSRTCVMAIGTLQEPDGKDHTVSFTSTNPNEQVVAVIEPGKLAVEPDRPSLTAVPGGALTLPVRVRRARGLIGPVRLEWLAPEHLRHVSAAAVTVSADQESAILTIRFGPARDVVYNAPFTVRATLMDHDRPVVGEAKIDIVAPQ